MSIISKLNFLLSKKHKKELVILIILLMFGVILEMMSLGILIPFITFLTNNNLIEKSKYLSALSLKNYSHTTLIIFGVALIFLIFLIKTIFLIYLSWRQSKFSSILFSDISNSLFQNYLAKNYIFHTLRNSSELLKNIQIEVDIFSYVSRSAMVMASEIAFIIGVTFLLLYVNPIGTSVVILFFGTAAYLFHTFTKNKLSKWGSERQISDENSYKQLTQAFGGIKDVILLNKKEYFLKNFDFHNSKKTRIIAKQNTLQLIPRMYLELLAILVMSVLISISVIQNKSIEEIFPILTIFVASAFRLIPSLNKIMGTIQVFRYAKPVIDLLYLEFTDEIESISNTTNGKIEFKECIKVKDISFNYPGSERFSLQNISILIEKGKSIGIIGTSGSGKSTFVDILMGIINPTLGNILVDNIDIKTNITKWQSRIGYVPQTIFLLDNTLRANVAFGEADNKIDDLKVWKALEIAELDKWVKSLPEQLNTDVGERGVRLSGGQRQRIGIARALYNDPDILVLDEATSSLDTDTEKKIMQSVNSLHGIKTLIIIAHRLSTVEECDLVYKLENGKINDYGEPSKFIINSKLS
jgi:ABC-type multidrug transport system fused ATPase/permease subunit